MKFRPSVQINVPGQPLLHVVLISNDPPPSDGALQKRIVSFYLHPSGRTFSREEQIKYQEEIERTAVSFLVLTNWLYHRVVHKQRVQIPKKWEETIALLSDDLREQSPVDKLKGFKKGQTKKSEGHMRDV
jgi:hypothetical protein